MTRVRILASRALDSVAGRIDLTAEALYAVAAVLHRAASRCFPFAWLDRITADLLACAPVPDRPTAHVSGDHRRPSTDYAASFLALRPGR